MIGMGKSIRHKWVKEYFYCTENIEQDEALVRNKVGLNLLSGETKDWMNILT